jgi:hypothetical protein
VNEKCVVVMCHSCFFYSMADNRTTKVEFYAQSESSMCKVYSFQDFTQKLNLTSKWIYVIYIGMWIEFGLAWMCCTKSVVQIYACITLVI